MRYVWRMLTGARFAVLLMIVLAMAAVLGALIPQIPSDLAGGDADYQWWMDTVARPKFGVAAGFLEFLDLFDVFHSSWFLAIGALLMTSILACTVRRWPTTRALLAGGRVKYGREFYASGKYTSALNSVHAEPSRVTTEVLKSHGYRIRSEHARESRTTWIAADKNRYYRLGTYMIHLSLIFLLAGYLMSSYIGFRVTEFIVPEGTVREVGHNTGLSLELLEFGDEYWVDGTPKDYRSEVVIYKDGQQVKQGTVRVNNPLSYGGVRFYQSFFGPAAEIQVTDSEGKLLFQEVIPLSSVIEVDSFQRPVGMFNLTQPGLDVYLVGPAFGAPDPYIFTEQIGLEVYDSVTYLSVGWSVLDEKMTDEISDLQFTLVRNASYTGLQVKRDPGVSLIWVGSAFFLLGLVSVFLFPYRQLWVAVDQRRDGRGQVRLRAKEGSGPFASSDYRAVTDELRQKLEEKHATGSGQDGETIDG